MRVRAVGSGVLLSALVGVLLAATSPRKAPVLWRIPVVGSSVGFELSADWLWLSTNKGIEIRDPVTTEVLGTGQWDRARRLFSSGDLHVYIDRETRNIEAFDPLTGAVLWKSALQEREMARGGGSGVLVTARSIEGERGKRRYQLRGIDTKTGEERWKLTVPIDYELVVGERVLVAGRDGLVVIELETGRILHRSQTVVEPRAIGEGGGGEVWYTGYKPNEGPVFGRLVGSPLRLDTASCEVGTPLRMAGCRDTIFAMDSNGVVTGYDAVSCAPRGQWAMGRSRSMTAGEIGGRCALVVHTADDEVVALDVEGGLPASRTVTIKGRVSWQTHAPVLEARIKIHDQTVPIDEDGRFAVTVEGAGVARVEIEGQTADPRVNCLGMQSVALDRRRKTMNAEVVCFTHIP